MRGPAAVGGRERGAIAAPAFFTVAALARALDLDLADLARTLMPPGERTPLAG